MKKYTMLRLDVDTHKQLKILSALNGVSMIDLVQKLIETYKKEEVNINENC